VSGKHCRPSRASRKRDLRTVLQGGLIHLLGGDRSKWGRQGVSPEKPFYQGSNLLKRALRNGYSRIMGDASTRPTLNGENPAQVLKQSRSNSDNRGGGLIRAGSAMRRPAIEGGGKPSAGEDRKFPWGQKKGRDSSIGRRARAVVLYGCVLQRSPLRTHDREAAWSTSQILKSRTT